MARLFAALLVAVVATACIGGPPPGPPPTPDPFSGLSERADEALREGLSLYEQGRYREALAAFERARLLSPTADPRIDQMIERTRAALQPTPAPGEASPSPTLPPPTPTPVFLNPAVPDADLGARYFGLVYLTAVPGRDTLPPPQNEFYYQDQIGLYVEAVQQRLRVPFALRVFELDTGRLIANVRQDGPVPTTVPGQRPPATSTPTPGGTPSASPTPGPGDFKVVRFWDKFVWYHEGGEAPGRYRVELYAEDRLTHAFDYVVGTVPVPPVVVPSPEGTPAPAGEQPAATPAPAGPPAPAGEGKVSPPTSGGGGGAPAGPPPPTSTPAPTPTPLPAVTTVIGGIPAGLDTYTPNNLVFIADASGVVWTVDGGRPTLARPFTLDRKPVDLAVDPTSGTLYVATRSEASIAVLNGGSGQRIATIPLGANPGDVRFDPALGLLYVVLPERQSVAVVDVRAQQVVSETPNLVQVSGIALDLDAHTVYLSHLQGGVSVLDGSNGQVVSRIPASGPGLSGIATARGLVHAINSVTNELIVVNPSSGAVSAYPLPDQPGAVAASEVSGSVFVLGTRTNLLLRINPANGAELGRVQITDRSGRFGVKPVQPDYQGLRPRIALHALDDTAYVTQPETGTLSVIPASFFSGARAAAPPERGWLVALGQEGS